MTCFFFNIGSFILFIPRSVFLGCVSKTNYYGSRTHKNNRPILSMRYEIYHQMNTSRLIFNTEQSIKYQHLDKTKYSEAYLLIFRTIELAPQGNRIGSILDIQLKYI